MSKHLGHAKRQDAEAVEKGRQSYEQTLLARSGREHEREQKLVEAQSRYETAQDQERLKVESHNSQVDLLENCYQSGTSEGVTNYIAYVLARTFYPEDFPRENRLAYVPESKQLVVELMLPTVAVVPEVTLYRYVKSSDQRTESARPATQRRQLYASVVAQVALRTLHEVFSSDSAEHIETVVLNGVVDTINPGTGQAIQ
jgi:restriction system protein